MNKLIHSFWLSLIVLTTVQAQSRSSIAHQQQATSRASISRDSALINPQMAIQVLMAGNRRFVANKITHPHQDTGTLHHTEGGQHPFAIIVGCSDSRESSEIIFDQGIGDLFVIRTAGQVMSPVSYGSIEYATLHLGSKLLVVMGHQNCGAVTAALTSTDAPPGHIGALINAIKPSVEKIKNLPGDPLANTVRQNVLDQVNDLRKLDPILSNQYSTGEILIVGAVYNLHNGSVEFLPETLSNLPSPAKAQKQTERHH